MPIVEFKGKKYEVDDEGFLKNSSEWDKDFAFWAARQMEIKRLSKKHWEVIMFARSFYERHCNVPSAYTLIIYLKIKECQLFKMFAYTPRRAVGRIAGMPEKLL